MRDLYDYLKNGVTFAAVDHDTVYTSKQKGIRPMLELIENKIELKGFEVADKVVGKAAAMLFVKAGISKVYAEVISIYGKEYLEKNGVKVDYKNLTDRIINRLGNGMCPMEETVISVDDFEEGYRLLKDKYTALQKGDVKLL